MPVLPYAARRNLGRAGGSASFAGEAAPMIQDIVRREPSRARSKAAAAPAPTVRSLLHDVAEGIRVLQSRDGVMLSEAQIQERARNIVAGLLGNYRIRPLDPGDGQEPKPPRPLAQMDLLDLLEQLERRAEARNNGKPGRA
jgi:hypothetical protein